MPKYTQEVMKMFSDEILQKIFADEDVKQVPLVYQSIMVHAIENVLEEEKEGEE